MRHSDPLRLVPTSAGDDDTEIVREIDIAAPPDIVFSHFTDPAKLPLWQGTYAEADPRPGGNLHIRFGPGYAAEGQYVLVDPPRRVVYTWGWAEEGSAVLPAGASTVDVTFTPTDYGTHLRLRHYGLPPVSREFHRDGW